MIDIESLNLTDEDRARVDSEFLDAAINRVNGQGKLSLSGATILELEQIHGRAFEKAHEDIIAEKPLSEPIVRNLAKLSFLDTLWIPTHDKVKRSAPAGMKINLDLGDTRRRLFATKAHNK